VGEELVIVLAFLDRQKGHEHVSWGCQGKEGWQALAAKRRFRRETEAQNTKTAIFIRWCGARAPALLLGSGDAVASNLLGSHRPQGLGEGQEQSPQSLNSHP
jgi:hypothetical protein